MDTDLVMPGFGKKSVQFEVFDGSYKGETCGPPPGNLHAPVTDYHTCINYATDHSGEFKDTFDWPAKCRWGTTSKWSRASA